MLKIEWEDNYSVGHQEIDNQHKQWIAFYNELHDYMMSGGTEGKQLEMLKKIIDYTDYHFKYEEHLMKEFGFEHLIPHVREHVAFRNKMTELYNDVEHGELVLNSQLLSKMLNWLTDHILSEDKKYAKLFGGRED